MTYPQPRNMDCAELSALMKDIGERVLTGDSFEGNIAYAIPEDDDAPPRSFDVVATYRVGNTMGQGGMRMIGNWDDAPPPDHGAESMAVARMGDRAVLEAYVAGLDGAALTNLAACAQALADAAGHELGRRHS